MTKGTVVAWHIQEGQRVQKGQTIAEIETDKIVYKIEAPEEGVLLKMLSEVGQTYPVGRTIAIIGAEGEEIVVSEQPDKAPISPSARRVARELGVDLAGLTGTGQDGWIVKEDVLRAAEKSKDSADLDDLDEKTGAGRLVPLSAAQWTVASHTQASAQTIPHVTLQVTADAGALLQARDAHRDAVMASGVKLKYINWTNDLLIYLVSRAMAKDGTFNCRFEDGAIRYFDEVHIGLAIALRDGLVVPVIHNADRSSLMEIARQRASLVQKARSGSLEANDVTGGTFTITNLGMYPVDHFQAIINAPQAAILSIGRTRQEPVVADGAIVARDVIGLGFTFDHRVGNGAEAGKFLALLVKRLTKPGIGQE
jgi:pyruvate dehydrogenase E2 component (dihydrolipoamide acetyltransferase)